MSSQKFPSRSYFKNFLKSLQVDTDNPYDEIEAVKHLFDEEVSSDNTSEISTAETVYAKTVPYRSRCRVCGTKSGSSVCWHSFIILLNIATLCLSITLFFVTGCKINIPLFHNSQHNNSLLRQTSEYSPIFDAITIPLSHTFRNGSFTETSPPSIYRQDPSPAVDAAWARIANINTIPLSAADVLARGVDPSTTAKYPLEFGFGADAHIGRLDVFHQIHCLDALRREIHFKHYYGGKFKDDIPTPSHRAHVRHCMEIILEGLMCAASVDPILHYWVDIQESPFPNFNDRHMCRDFSKILEWQEANSVDLNYFNSVVKKPAQGEGVQVHRMSEAYKQALTLNQVATNRYEGED